MHHRRKLKVMNVPSQRPKSPRKTESAFWSMPYASVIALVGLALLVGWPWFVWHNTVTGWVVGVLWNLVIILPAVAAKIFNLFHDAAETRHRSRVKQLEQLRAERIEEQRLAEQRRASRAEGSTQSSPDWKADKRESRKQRREQMKAERQRVRDSRRKVAEELQQERLLKARRKAGR